METSKDCSRAFTQELPVLWPGSWSPPPAVIISPPEPPGEPAVSVTHKGTTATQIAGRNGSREPSWTGQHLHSVAEFPAKGQLGWTEANRVSGAGRPQASGCPRGSRSLP